MGNPNNQQSLDPVEAKLAGDRQTAVAQVVSDQRQVATLALRNLIGYLFVSHPPEFTLQVAMSIMHGFANMADDPNLPLDVREDLADKRSRCQSALRVMESPITVVQPGSPVGVPASSVAPMRPQQPVAHGSMRGPQRSR